MPRVRRKPQKRTTKNISVEDLDRAMQELLKDPKVMRVVNLARNSGSIQKALDAAMGQLHEAFAGIRDRGHLFHAKECVIRTGSYKSPCSSCCGLDQKVFQAQDAIKALYSYIEMIFKE